ncbi:MAG: TlpA disulfide reductase family protein [Halobacteriovoraceae bacterium]|nr:TlpA disulfide reductase family protein [Halobacteriovoraceae bacterium]
MSGGGQKRLISILSIVLLTFLYAYYHKSVYRDFFLIKNDPILKELPSTLVKDIKNNEFNIRSLINQKNGGLVHFWGTWCAPCEEELPSFINLARPYEKKGIIFLLLAVKDNPKKVKRFLSRFSNLPKNIVLALDEQDSSMEKFGTLKVPETYMFDKKGQILKKFIGPQDWDNRYFTEKINHYLIDNH